jgi:pimeloyl-ACP methyl ester carboxylesterase
MNPFFFGQTPRKLFGIYEPARSVTDESRAVVFCYPWGPEYFYAHRSLQRLSKMLVKRGIHSLRFDYFGTGDSAGETIEADLEGWCGDIETSIDELTHITGCHRVILIGMRLGGTLAAKVATKRADRIEALVLWDPIISGAEYLNALWLAHTRMPRIGQLPIRRRPEFGGGFEVLGFALSESMEQDMKGLSLTVPITDLSTRTMIVISEMTESAVALSERLAARPSQDIAIETIQDLHPWIERNDAGAVPAKVMKRITQWIA